jgi:hypothetical protein
VGIWEYIIYYNEKCIHTVSVCEVSALGHGCSHLVCGSVQIQSLIIPPSQPVLCKPRLELGMPRRITAQLQAPHEPSYKQKAKTSGCSEIICGKSTNACKMKEASHNLF